MTLITYPLNEVDYSAEDAELFHCTRSSGVYASDDFTCTVTGTDNTVTVAPGLGWIRNSKFTGKAIALKTEMNIDMGLPDAVLDRIDVVTIRFDGDKNTTEIVVKNGTPASAPAIPAITQTDRLYELYLCSAYRKAAATTITGADITDLRLDSRYCGLMADSVSEINTEMMRAQFEAFMQSIQKELSELEAGTGVELKKRTFFDVEVDAADFVADDTYPDYPARAQISLADVTASMIPDVTFSLTDAVSGNFAPVAETYNGGIYIYAAEAPAGATIIPTIVCWRGS